MNVLSDALTYMDISTDQDVSPLLLRRPHFYTARHTRVLSLSLGVW